MPRDFLREFRDQFRFLRLRHLHIFSFGFKRDLTTAPGLIPVSVVKSYRVSSGESGPKGREKRLRQRDFFDYRRPGEARRNPRGTFPSDASITQKHRCLLNNFAIVSFDSRIYSRGGSSGRRAGRRLRPAAPRCEDACTEARWRSRGEKSRAPADRALRQKKRLPEGASVGRLSCVVRRVGRL